MQVVELFQNKFLGNTASPSSKERLLLGMIRPFADGALEEHADTLTTWQDMITSLTDADMDLKLLEGLTNDPKAGTGAFGEAMPSEQTMEGAQEKVSDFIRGVLLDGRSKVEREDEDRNAAAGDDDGKGTKKKRSGGAKKPKTKKKNFFGKVMEKIGAVAGPL